MNDTTAMVVVAGLTTHMVFRRWEPTDIPTVTLLLGILPSYLLLPHSDKTLTATLVTLAVFYGTLLCSILFYRLSPSHPIARYPGPVLCKLSKLYMVWFAMKGYQHKYIQQLHERYGDVVRIGPNEISIRNVSAIQPLMGSQGLPKGPGLQGRGMHQPIPALIAYRNAAEHSRRRKPWNRAFSSSSLKEFQPIVARRAAQLVESLVSHEDTVDLAQWISFFAYDFMGDMAFGGGTEMLEEGDKDELWQLIRDGLEVSLIYDHMPWLPLFTQYIPGVGQDLKRLRAMAIERGMKRYARGATSKDLFYYLSNEDDKETETPTRNVVLADAVLAVLAGADTTASVLSSILWCILRNPDTYSRLQAEVDKFYPTEEDALDTKHHPNMPYLEAVINETLRLYPAVPDGSQRAPEPHQGDRVVGPYYLPEGTQARVHFWSVHRDSRHFSYPEAFWPDRWLISEGLQETDEPFVHNPNAFIPFSFGPWNCVGKNLALQEIRVVLCHMMQKLHIRYASGWNPDEWQETLQDKFIFRTGRLPVEIQRR